VKCIKTNRYKQDASEHNQHLNPETLDWTFILMIKSSGNSDAFSIKMLHKLTYHAGESMGAEESGAASLAIFCSVWDVLGVLEVDLLLAGAAGPAGLAAVDPRGEVAVLVWPDVALLAPRLLPAVHEAVEVEQHLRRRAHALVQVTCGSRDQLQVIFIAR
jgi:hypothetical protein